MLDITYMGSAPGWNFPHSTWSTCIDLLPFLVSKLWNALPPTVRESEDTVSFKRALNVHMT